MTELQMIDKQMHKKDVEVTVMCTLFEFYNGVLKEVHYRKMKATAVEDKYTSQACYLTINIKPGYGEHTVLRYPGYGHESFGSHPSDLVIRFKQLPDDTHFTRRGSDLVFVHTLNLIDALQTSPFTI